MKSFKIKIFFAIVCTVILVVVLYSMETTPPESTTAINSTLSGKGNWEIVFNEYFTNAKKELRPEDLSLIDGLERDIYAGKEIIIKVDSLIKTWERLNQPLIVAKYHYQKASMISNEQNWLTAAKEYYHLMQQNHSNVSMKEYLVNNSISSYEKVLEINPVNIDAKSFLAMCYTEKGEEPMKGVKMLLDVIKENPDHVNTLINLGILSVRSGQYQKALERFEKVINIEPENSEAYLYLSETFKLLGDKQKEESCMEKHRQIIEKRKSTVVLQDSGV